MSPKNLCYLLVSCFGFNLSGYSADRIPFYEDYLQESDLIGFLEDAKHFLATSPDSPQAPRIAMDYMMVGKASNQPKVVDEATDLLLYKYPQSLPSLQFISSFDIGSPRLTGLLQTKAEQGDLGSKDFAVTYCRTLIFVARIKGPELLKDVSLRLRAYLFASLAEVEEIQEKTLSSLQKISEKTSPIGRTLKIVLSERTNLEKIHLLSLISGSDAKFCLDFYQAQLTPLQANSEEMIIFQAKQILFGHLPDTSRVRDLISNLPPAKITSPSVLALLAFSHHLDNDHTKAIEVLQNGAKGAKDPSWQAILESYAKGLTFSQDRKPVLLAALDKAIEQLNQETDCFSITAKWKSDLKEGRKIQHRILVGISKTQQTFEIQYWQDNQLFMGYQSTGNSSKILTPESDKIYCFKSQGALPMPSVTIKRDDSTGSFSYNFNLNFGSSFSEFIENGSAFLENPYIATTKGREVLCNHILGSKMIWLEATDHLDNETTFPIMSLPKGDQKALLSSLTFDLEGNLKSSQFGHFSISSIARGEANILEVLPSWPELETIEKKEFDFSLFMKMVGALGAIAQN